jgi:hypothetical protein
MWNGNYWPIVADQEPRISGVFCVWGTATYGRFSPLPALQISSTQESANGK